MENGFKQESMAGFDGEKVMTYLWDNVKKPRAVMLIAHGMCEHAKRYDEFARYLNGQGIIVFAPDLRGHGLTAGKPELVCRYPNGGDIWSDTVNDLIFFADKLIKKHKLPLVALGHSYGSFLMQGFLQAYDKQACTVLVGSAFMRDANTAMGGVVAGLTKFFKGGAGNANLIVALSFGSYGKGFEHGNWLTRDLSIAKAYREDPYCGARPSANFYKSMFKGLKKITEGSALGKISKTMPVLITSGSKDPVGGKNVNLTYKLYNKYKEAGLERCELKIWDDGRHEILNETNRKEIYEYVLQFINKNI